MRAKWTRKMNLVAWKPTWYKSLKILLQIQFFIWHRLGHGSLLIRTTQKVLHICSNQLPSCLNGGWPTPRFSYLWYYTEGTYIYSELISNVSAWGFRWISRNGENKDLILTGVACNIHQNSDSWWISTVLGTELAFSLHMLPKETVQIYMWY